MKKTAIFTFIILLFGACNVKEENTLAAMKKAFAEHVVKKDIENKTQTTVKYLKAVSYEETPEDKRENPDEFYAAKIYLESRWVYLNSSRIYNVADTLDCYFDKDINLLRVGKLKEKKLDDDILFK